MARIRTAGAAIGLLAVLATAACSELSAPGDGPGEPSPGAGTDPDGGDPGEGDASEGHPGGGDPAAVDDLDAEGLASYACALVSLDEPVAENESFIGPDADPVVAAVAGASGLLGAYTGTPLPGYEDLFEPAQEIYQGIGRVDLDLLQDGVDELVAACAHAGLPVGDPDVTEEGRRAYACALVAAVDGAAPAEDWSGIGDADEDAALTRARAGGFAGLGGGMNVWVVPGHEPLSTASSDMTVGISVMNTDSIDEAAAAGAEHCRSI